MPQFTNIPKQVQAYQSELIQAANEVIHSGWYLFGERLTEFEAAFARYCKVKHCIGVANGFDALQLILMAHKELGQLKDGDEVLIPANTFVATALAVTKNGLKLKVAEPNPHSFNLDAPEIEKAITAQTKAIIPVHLYGRVADVESIRPFLQERGILMIEDAAQAHGAKFRGKLAGTIGQAAAFSFYPVKNLGAMADAGAVVTNDDALAEVIRSLRNYGGTKYQIDYQGINSRMSELQAALLRVRLKYLDRENQRRSTIAYQYLNAINHPLIQLPIHSAAHQSVWHQFVIRSTYRDELKHFLEKAAIPSLIHYPIPIHQQPAYPELNALHLPISEQLSQEILSIPIAPHLTDEEVAYIIQQINSFEPKVSL
ncbi:MAG: DegT/DnrJ/EryC1/StrS family aminotransferase [Flammeovirgaceae bacterium]